MTESVGRFIILAGVVLIALGLALEFANRLPRVPGDLVIQRPNVTVFIPIGTMILVSVVLTILLNLLARR